MQANWLEHVLKMRGQGRETSIAKELDLDKKDVKYHVIFICKHVTDAYTITAAKNRLHFLCATVVLDYETVSHFLIHNKMSFNKLD